MTWIRFIIFAASLQFLFLSKYENKNRFLICAFIALIYVNFEMFIEYFTGSSLYSKIRFNFIDGLLFNGGNNRIAGPFKDSPKSGIYLAYFIFPIILGMAELIKIKFSKYYSLFFILFFVSVNLFLIYLSGHRASMLSATISLFFIFSYLFFFKKKKFLKLI